MIMPEVKWILQSAGCTPVLADRYSSEVKRILQSDNIS